MNKAEDLTGARFGRLTAIERAENYKHITYYPDGTKTYASIPRWVCKCDCGKFITVISSNLKSGRQVSCGCYMIEKLKRRKHGRAAQKDM